MSERDSRRAIEAVFRIESARLIAGLVRMVRDVGLAEELAQDAMVTALERWPVDGVPDNPGAWLMATAKNRAIDRVRRDKRLHRAKSALDPAADPDLELKQRGPDLDEQLDDPLGDDVLRLMFTACHPVLSAEARVALTLRLLGGLSTAEIARAFLAQEPAIAQRIVRAKRTLTDAQVPFEVPRGAELQARVDSVLEVLYLIFNEGYAASAGDDWMRPALCDEAMRLGRALVARVHDVAEAHALLALMELQASRTAARVGRDGEPILLLEQDRAKWDTLLIERGFASLARAHSLGGARGPYALQAAIAACHARARTASETDWSTIAALYAVLAQVTPSAVVELNRAIAVSMAEGPARGLELLDAVRDDPALREYPFVPAARAEQLSRLGRWDEARDEFTRAAALTHNQRQRAHLLERAAKCIAPNSSAP